MHENARKRLVSKTNYVCIMGRLTSLPLLGMTSFFAGISLLFAVLVELAFLVSEPSTGRLLTLLTTIGLSAMALLAGNKLLVQASEIEPVQPITAHNTYLLPPEDSLVRASDSHSAQPQRKLLRAAVQGRETPPEQLLRATHEDEQDF